jgi:SAM-dependent methyltransferase
MALPFKEKTFDAVVILGSLEDIHTDEAFIEECHRVLKTDGRLVINVPHIKDWSLINILRTVLGLTPEKRGMVRPGYTETDLFRLLKNGFDVHHMRSYSRFFLELADTVSLFLVGRPGKGGEGEDKKRLRVYSMFSPLYWLAFQLDILLFFTRGHHLIALAKRRSWRPRNAPVLVDGRSISEAVLTKPAD